jgi:hypothetical protein
MSAFGVIPKVVRNNAANTLHFGVTQPTALKALRASSALLRSHHVDTARCSRNLLTAALRALRLTLLVLRHGLGTLKIFPALLTTV